MAKRGPAAGASADRRGIYRWNSSNTRLRPQRQCQTIGVLGARVLFELIDELDHVHGLAADLDASLERYSTLNPEILRVLRGDRMPHPTRLARIMSSLVAPQ